MHNNEHLAVKTVAALLVGTFVTFVLLAMVPSGKAIPAFSRKYQTSCTTCHNNYPELNDFGVAFKKNGFKFPTDDDTFVKQEPVMLGSKGAEGSVSGSGLSGRNSGDDTDRFPL